MVPHGTARREWVKIDFTNFTYAILFYFILKVENFHNQSQSTSGVFLVQNSITTM